MISPLSAFRRYLSVPLQRLSVLIVFQLAFFSEMNRWMMVYLLMDLER